MTALVPDDGLMAIGKVAELVGVSERTLRYYEEVGLLTPTGHSPGGCRRYVADDVERVSQIRELQEVMGYSLEEIQSILALKDRMAAIRTEWHGGAEHDEQVALLAEAMSSVEGTRARVRAKAERLQRILAELDATVARYQAVAERLAGHQEVLTT
ncbi:MAG: MerR family transcriptional regulator [Acidimicrobiales bacterium]